MCVSGLFLFLLCFFVDAVWDGDSRSGSGDGWPAGRGWGRTSWSMDNCVRYGLSESMNSRKGGIGADSGVELAHLPCTP